MDDFEPSKKESIRVMVRFRPENKQEKKIELLNKTISDLNILKQIKIINNHEIHLESEHTDKRKNKLYSFGFDKIFNGNISQKKIFHYVAEPLINSMLRGYNGTILVYGQSGSGKTYTMYGPESNKNNMKINEFGLIPMSLAYIFSIFNDKESVFMNNNGNIVDYNISLEFIEVYNEKLRDLLDITNSPFIKETKNTKTGIWLPEISNITTKIIYNLEEGLACIHTAISNRTVAQTNLNQSSSRSHLLMRLKLTTIYNDGKQRVGIGNFADLAGSEVVKKTKAKGMQLKEAGNILKSLSCLSNVIHALEKNKKHIPFKDSKLTYLLKNSLGGNCKTKLLLCGSPHIFNRQETIRTLEFGKRCKKIKCSTSINESITEEQIKKDNNMLKLEIEKLKKNLMNISNSNSSVNNVLQNDLNKLTKENNNLKKKIVIIKQECNELEMTLKDAMEREDEMGVKYNELVIKYTSISSQEDFIEALKNENEKLKKENKNFKKIINKLKNNKILNEFEKKDDNKNINNNKQHIASLKQTTELNVTIDNLRNELNNLYDKLHKIEDEKDNLSNQVINLNKTLQVKDNVINIMKKKNLDTNAIQERIDQLETNCEEKENIIKELKLKNKKLIHKLKMEQQNSPINNNNNLSNQQPLSPSIIESPIPGPPTEDIPDDLIKRYVPEKDKHFFSPDENLNIKKNDRKIIRSQTKTLRDMFEDERQSRKMSNFDNKNNAKQKNNARNRRLLGYKKQKKQEQNSFSSSMSEMKDNTYNNNTNTNLKRHKKSRSGPSIPLPPITTSKSPKHKTSPQQQKWFASKQNDTQSNQSNLYMHRGSLDVQWIDNKNKNNNNNSVMKPSNIITNNNFNTNHIKSQTNTTNVIVNNAAGDGNNQLDGLFEEFKMKNKKKPTSTQFMKFCKSNGVILKFKQARAFLKGK